MARHSRYKEAGVDLDKANELVKRIQPLVRQTFHANVITDIGGFGGLYSLDCSDMKSPVLVSSTDGVGTKLKVAFWADKHDTVGIDLVAMCVNDIIVQGARPLFFLDYLAVGSMDLERVEAVVRGIAEGCKQACCSLIGGETAEMPGFYGPNEYDLAGFAVGIVDNPQIIDGSTIHKGDQIIGLASSGLHSNGYSLVRRVLLDEMKMSPDTYLAECGRTAAEELLEPTQIYVDPVMKLLKQFDISGMAHITGGGFEDNLERILPKPCQAVVEKASWERPPIFSILQEAGKISEEEMLHVFNCGIGYVVVVRERDLEEVLDRLAGMGQKAYRIGEVVTREEDAPPVRLV